MEENEIFNKESVKKYITEKVNALDNFDTLFDIYRFVRRLTESNNERTVTGSYRKENGFTEVYTNDTLYTIANNGDWGAIKVGQKTAIGWILTREDFERYKAECDKVGTFTLK